MAEENSGSKEELKSKPEAEQKSQVEKPNPKIGVKPRDVLESDEAKRRRSQNLME